MHLPARPTCAVKGACKGVHRSEAETLYSAGWSWTESITQRNKDDKGTRCMADCSAPDI
jgi:hypothetical protein